MEEIQDVIIRARGEVGTDEAVNRIKDYYGVKLLSELSREQKKAVLIKFENEIKNKNDRKVCKCGAIMVRKGMFFICMDCHSILDLS